MIWKLLIWLLSLFITAVIAYMKGAKDTQRKWLRKRAEF